MSNEDWMKTAMSDDAVVAELLLHLHRQPSRLPLEWKVRQRRSKPFSIANCSKKTTGARASPTTPLSWSGATSFSGDGGAEESSWPFNLSSITRSKVNEESDKTIIKRPRKKKTLTELKEEENRLVKERRELKRDIAAARSKLENQLSEKRCLKRVKNELQHHQTGGTNSGPNDWNSGDARQNRTALHFIPPTDANFQYSTASQKKVEVPVSKFILPDLNMPLEEEHIHEVACNVS